MSVISKRYFIFLLIIGLAVIPVVHGAEVQERPQTERSQTEKEAKDAGVVAIDLLISRPLGILATVAGGAIFLVSLPISAMTGQTRMVYDKMVREPARYAFKRPIGDF
ncbi:MAG TPA: multidrug transporter [Desulfobacteraceae bacterium]|jgi:hypothetical protein|nr:multidrug transporter [Desulfobacteraceae bacterium]